MEPVTLKAILFGCLTIIGAPFIIIGLVCLYWIIKVSYHWVFKKEILVPHYTIKPHSTAICGRYYWSMTSYHYENRKSHNKKIKFYIKDYLFRP